MTSWENITRIKRRDGGVTEVTVTRVSGEQVIYKFSPQLEAVVEVSSGALVEFTTIDAFGGQVKSESDRLESIDFSRVNPASGPVAITGAEPGDALQVDILDITTDSVGIVTAVPGLGVLGHRVTEPQTKLVKIGPRFIEFDQKLRLPKKPMIGVIGVAPAEGEIPCGTPGDHGGNMDTTEICPGNRLFLPVFQPGALFALGDVHAAMGDGEVCGTGVECAAKVLVRLTVLKNFGIKRPMLETRSEIQTIASAVDVSDAAKLAVADMIEYLKQHAQLSFNEAYMLLSVYGSVKISQLVDPLLTVRVAISKEVLGSLGVW